MELIRKSDFLTSFVGIEYPNLYVRSRSGGDDGTLTWGEW